MSIRITNAEGGEEKTTATIDLGLKGLPDEVKAQIQDDVGNFLVEQVLLSVADAKSPVDGEKFPALSTAYKKRKLKEGGQEIANLQLTGDMLSSLEFKTTDKGIEIGFFGAEASKADGHLNFSGDSKLAAVGKQRRFLPDKGQAFKSDIERGIEQLIAEGQAQLLTKEDFVNVQTSEDLYAVLQDNFPELSDPDLKRLALTTDNIKEVLDEYNIAGLL